MPWVSLTPFTEPQFSPLRNGYASHDPSLPIYVLQPSYHSRGELAHEVKLLLQEPGFGEAAFAVPEVIRT